MSLPNSLMQMLSLPGGFVSTAQANSVGISNERLRLFVKAGALERSARGLYSLPDELQDSMYLMQLRSPKIIYSHDTALYLHNLTDRAPISYSVTITSGHNTSKLIRDNLIVFTIKKELLNLGVCQRDTVFGNQVTTYGMERTICDSVRSRSRLDIAIVTDALKQYAKRKDKDLNLLMQYAELFRVAKQLRSYMEVLL